MFTDGRTDLFDSCDNDDNGKVRRPWLLFSCGNVPLSLEIKIRSFVKFCPGIPWKIVQLVFDSKSPIKTEVKLINMKRSEICQHRQNIDKICLQSVKLKLDAPIFAELRPIN